MDQNEFIALGNRLHRLSIGGGLSLLGYRCAGRDALVDILQGRMHEDIDRHLDRMSEGDEADRRNGV